MGLDTHVTSHRRGPLPCHVACAGNDNELRARGCSSLHGTTRGAERGKEEKGGGREHEAVDKKKAHGGRFPCERLKAKRRAEEARCTSAPPQQRAAPCAIGPSLHRPPRRRPPAARTHSAAKQRETARRGQRVALAACEKHRCRAHSLGGDEVRRVEGALTCLSSRRALARVDDDAPVGLANSVRRNRRRAGRRVHVRRDVCSTQKISN